MADELAAVVMAGGLGTRMKSATPKHLHPLLGRRMVDWVIAAARSGGADRIVVVASPDTAALYDGEEVAVQEQARGTGDAVRAAHDALQAARGDVLVLFAVFFKWLLILGLIACAVIALAFLWFDRR